MANDVLSRVMVQLEPELAQELLTFVSSIGSDLVKSEKLLKLIRKTMARLTSVDEDYDVRDKVVYAVYDNEFYSHIQITDEEYELLKAFNGDPKYAEETE